MSISAQIIQSASGLSNELKKMKLAVNAGTASAADINASLLTLEEKKGLESVRAGTATRVGINSLSLPLQHKNMLLQMAGV